YRYGIHNLSNMVYPTILIAAGLVVNRRTMILLTAYNILCVGFLVFGELAGWIESGRAIQSDPADFFSSTIILVITAIMVRLITEALFNTNIQLKRELAEKKLAEKKYRSIFENSISGLFQTTRSGRYLNVNPAMARIYGYTSPEEMIESVTDIASQIYVDPANREALLQRLEAGEPVSGFEAQNYRKDKSVLWVSTNMQAIHDEMGNLVYYEGILNDITQRKQMEAENRRVREELQQFRNLLDESNDAIFLIDPETSLYLDFNKTACEKLGYNREELARLKVLHVAEHITSIEVWRDRINLVRHHGGMLFETRYRRKDGSAFPVEVSARMHIYGEKPILVAIARDISERNRALAALKASEERLQVFFHQSLDGFFFCILDEPLEWNDRTDKEKALQHIYNHQRFTEANNALLEQYGFSREYFLHSTSADIFGHAPKQGLQLRRDLFDKGYLHTETHERKIDGTPVWFEGDYVCMYDDQKRITGFFCIQRDITNRRRVEEERETLIRQLELKNAESETLRESLAVLVGTVNFDQIIQNILDQIKSVVPYDTASIWQVDDNIQKLIAGRNLPDLKAAGADELHPDEQNSAAPILNGEVPYILNNNVQEELADFQKPPHTYVNSWLAIPLKTRGKIIGIIALDGKRKGQFNEHHAELAVSFANQVAIALENSQLFNHLQKELSTREYLIRELESKNAELERFAYTVSHDLKSPLVTINGFLGYLENDVAMNNMERFKQDCQRIRDAVNKMQDLLAELLGLSRIGRVKNPSQAVSFGELVQEAMEIVHGRIEARQIKVSIQPDLPMVFGDRQRMIEILQNLLDNAAKFMGTQPNPHIEIGSEEDRQDNSMHVFYVRDNGIGIPENLQERIFGIFDKLDPDSEGSGVGLAIVKRIVEVHGGRIWIGNASSSQGQGSTFYFTLPKAENPTNPTGETA
ncbi:MAG: PAS domain S-box protein, partial [Anaerolineales bacterium]|nr:PAS domain S-box protein [Anaerolineales bacterium]